MMPRTNDASQGCRRLPCGRQRTLTVLRKLLLILAPFAVAMGEPPPDRKPGEAAGKAAAGKSATDDLLNDIPDVKTGKRPERSPEPGSRKDGRSPVKGTSPPPNRLGREEGEDVGSGKGTGDMTQRRSSASLRELTDKMRQVQTRIDRRDLSSATQTRQREILDELAQLIGELESQQGQSGSRRSGGGKQQRDANSSADPSSSEKPDSEKRAERDGPPDRAGKQGTPRASDQNDPDSERTRGADGGPPSDAARNRMKSVWGQLPERVRQQILNLAPDLFLPKYERMIEEYYQRLSESE